MGTFTDIWDEILQAIYPAEQYLARFWPEHLEGPIRSLETEAAAMSLKAAAEAMSRVGGVS